MEVVVCCNHGDDSVDRSARVVCWNQDREGCGARSEELCQGTRKWLEGNSFLLELC